MRSFGGRDGSAMKRPRGANLKRRSVSILRTGQLSPLAFRCPSFGTPKLRVPANLDVADYIAQSCRGFDWQRTCPSKTSFDSKASTVHVCKNVYAKSIHEQISPFDGRERLGRVFPGGPGDGVESDNRASDTSFVLSPRAQYPWTAP